ncbi:methyl-accepting chemotaxis protein [Planobispora longispora]|uniref:Methyl-accepting transducer domain-containing protein n=1 Tax=Planobispora longispora TaxID=28887 RepID=A0A8J3S0M1_9ACTN|nr:methyl-accepting chemotaxis protein [Planobispora longispora]BFE89331.1 hypothetical protein GCM10020093_119330 [Planobispora longispora]GIH81478.1 hypothetical protein Plo01_79070 [Planobispora longispora]
MKWWRSRRAGTDVHPALQSREALMAALDKAPAVLLIVNETGDVLYRNQAADKLMQDTVAAYGIEALMMLAESLKTHLRKASSFPYTALSNLEVDGATTYGSLGFDRIPGGYIVTWEDATERVRGDQAVRTLSQELVATSALLAEAGDELARTAGDSASQAETVSHSSTELTGSIQEISQGVSSAAASTATAVESARDATRRMEQLQESSRQIGSITKLITEIAEQTKLLALNATIESARAGEMGKGFAVVASEVKDLAARTAEATAQITDMIDGIQAESTQAAAGISGIASLIDAVAEQQTLIAAAVEEQSATSAEMSRGMATVAGAGQAAAQAAETVLTAAEKLRDQSARLTEVADAAVTGRN